MYPFFSGLCGYVFGKNKAGNLDPSDIGLKSPRFLVNAKQIDSWNKTGLINAKVDDAAARTAFLKGQAAFWVTGPWNIDTIKKAGIKFQIVQIPAINCKSVPFLGVQGFMVTKFSQTHGVESAAKDLVASYMIERVLAGRPGRGERPVPGQHRRGQDGHEREPAAVRHRQQGRRADAEHPADGQRLVGSRSAWVKSTKGSGATRARIAFATAARNIANKIG